MKVVEAASPAVWEFLEVLAVFVAVVGLWFHGVGMVANAIGRQTSIKQPRQSSWSVHW
jgi:hypothetical protein